MDNVALREARMAYLFWKVIEKVDAGKDPDLLLEVAREFLEREDLTPLKMKVIVNLNA